MTSEARAKIMGTELTDIKQEKKKLRKGSVSLAEANPELAMEWHPTRNEGLAPENVSCGSNHKVWWRGKCKHEWLARVVDRVKGTGCPFCAGQKVLPGFNDLASQNPKLAEEWHPTKNETLTPSDVTNMSRKNVWWKGKCGHEWLAQINNRTAGYGCPFCAGQKVLPGFNDLASQIPEVAAEWHPVKNGNLTPHDVTKGSRRKVWWLGQCGHEWETRVVHRTAGRGCPVCEGMQLLVGYNDLATLSPRVAAEWHPTKNGSLTPSDVLNGAIRRVWWKCVFGHEWNTPVTRRTSHKTSCPVCNKRTHDSYNEMALFYYVEIMFPGAAHRCKVQGEEADIVIHDLNIAIEYDGGYWHGEKEISKDVGKYHHMSNAGYKLLRIRETRCPNLPDYEGVVFCVKNGRSSAETDKMIKEVLGYLNRLQPNAQIPNVDTIRDTEKIAACIAHQRYLRSLAYCFPDVAKGWDWDKNGDLSPEAIAAKSNKKVWWLCEREKHSFSMSPNHRTAGTRCPYCSGHMK